MSCGLNKDFAGQVLRFGVVGTVAVVVHYGVYWLLLSSWQHNMAYAMGYFVSFVVNYLLTATFTFRAGYTYGNGVGFALCHVVNFLLQMSLLNLFIYIGIDKRLVPAIVFAICVPTNFLMVRWVMSKNKKIKK